MPGDRVFASTLFGTDFENQDISIWSSSGGGASATISSEFSKSGSNSLKIQHDKTSSYGYQLVIPNIEGGMFYQAKGYGRSSDPSTASYFIRIAWYSSSDGSGSQLSTPSDSNLGSPNNDWAELATVVIQAPQTANSAKLRLVLTSKTSGSMATAFFDDVSFAEAVAPTLTPTETPVPTRQPTNTPTPAQLSSTSTPTLTIKPSISLSKKIIISSEAGVLGQSSESGNTVDISSPTKSVKTEVLSATDNTMIFKILISIGIVFIIGCAIVILYYLRHNKLNDINL